MMSRYAGFDVDLSGTLDAIAGVSAAPRRILSAQKRALGTLRRRIATEAKRDIQAEYNLKAGRIAQGLVVRNTADGIRLVGRSRGINAAAFGARWTRGGRGKNKVGAQYAIKRGAPATPQAGAFMARGRSNNRLVFERRGKPRLPLEAIYGPSIGQMLKHGRRPERLAEFALRVLEAEQKRLLGT